VGTAAKIGIPCEAVDAAARKVITDAGFGPAYKLPELPHRTGHGIVLQTNFHLSTSPERPLITKLSSWLSY
jgi:Xaa-Pro aminopeptidase